MKSVVAVFICIIYCCQAAAINGGKDVVVDGVAQSVPAVTIVTTESTKKDSPLKDTENAKDSIGPDPSTTPHPTPSTTNGTTTTLIPPTTNGTTTTPIPTTTNATTTTPTPPTTTNATTTTPTPTTTNATTTTPTPTTTNATTTTPTPTTTNATTPVPKPTPTSAPVTTTVVPPADRGFDGPSFIGGIVLASGLMAIGFVALKFYRARTELNYHTL